MWAGLFGTAGLLSVAVGVGGAAMMVSFVLAAATAALGSMVTHRRRRAVHNMQAPEIFAVIGRRTTTRILLTHLEWIPAASLAHPLYGETIARSVGLDGGTHLESSWLAEGFDGSVQELLDVLQRL